MTIFDSILNEQLSEAFTFKKKSEEPNTTTEENTELNSPELDTEENIEEPVEEIKETPEEELEDLPEDLEEPVEDTINTKLTDLCYSILDAIEAEELAQGETFDDDESVDVGIECIIKFAKDFSPEVAQGMYDILSEYFEMEVDENPIDDVPEGEMEEYFEEPSVENETTYEEDKVKE